MIFAPTRTFGSTHWSAFNDWRLLADEDLLDELASTPMRVALPDGVCRVLEAIYSEEELAGADGRGEGAEFLLFLTYTDRLLDVGLPGDEAGRSGARR